ncbi:MAG: GNAT family N-acetyltransferase, partial [Thermomicrobiales bacterium]
ATLPCREGAHMTDDSPTADAPASMPPIVNITGERVALGPLHHDLLPLFERWENELWAMDRGGADPRPLTTETVHAGWERNLRGERPDWLGFAIYRLPDLRPIGYINLRDFTNPHGTAEFGIMIGEAGERGHGYGTEATRLLLDYAFTVLGVHNVWLDTPAYNVGAIRAYEKVGFREIGRRRGARVLAGHRYDVVLMDCVAEEFVPPPSRALPDSG